jgi:hypothetical protein
VLTLLHAVKHNPRPVDEKRVGQAAKRRGLCKVEMRPKWVRFGSTIFA